MQIALAPPPDGRIASPQAGRLIVVTGGLYVEPTRRPRIDLDAPVPAMTFEDIEGVIEMTEEEERG